MVPSPLYQNHRGNNAFIGKGIRVKILHEDLDMERNHLPPSGVWQCVCMYVCMCVCVCVLDIWCFFQKRLYKMIHNSSLGAYLCCNCYWTTGLCRLLDYSQTHTRYSSQSCREKNNMVHVWWSRIHADQKITSVMWGCVQPFCGQYRIHTTPLKCVCYLSLLQ